MTDQFVEEWKRNVTGILSVDKIREYLSSRGITPNDVYSKVDRFARDIRVYKDEWVETSENNAQDGLYAKIMEFVEIKEGDLVVDICCGTGRVLEEIGRDGVIGLDMNPYVLEVANQRLREKGLDVVANTGTRISFDPSRGFVWLPTSVGSIDLSKTNLFTDDVYQLENLKRVLKSSGRKADVMINTLMGFSEAYDLNHLFFQSGTAPKLRNSTVLLESLLPKVSDMLNDDGRFYFGVRLHPGIANGFSLLAQLKAMSNGLRLTKMSNQFLFRERLCGRLELSGLAESEEVRSSTDNIEYDFRIYEFRHSE